MKLEWDRLWEGSAPCLAYLSSQQVLAASIIGSVDNGIASFVRKGGLGYMHLGFLLDLMLACPTFGIRSRV